MTTTQLPNNSDPDKNWNPMPKLCDYCQSTAALLHCRTHSAFMCMSCDAKLHSPADKHAKVWLCEVCEHSPAAVNCKADAASLCITCDHDIHAANPLARRHERVSVVPFFETAQSVLMKTAEFPLPEMKIECCDSDPWMIPDPCFGGSKYPAENPEFKSMEFLFNDSDQLLEFENFGISSQIYSDCVVPNPVQTAAKTPTFSPDYSSGNPLEFDFTRSNVSSFNKSSYPSPSLAVSSSIDVGVVPDSSAFSDVSYNFVKDPIAIPNLDLNQGSQIGMDREARVMRYREKRKNRKFEKTVRYASRKAYAETRPRIKGRFAKRTGTKTESDENSRMFGFGSGNIMDEEIFGVVPSFMN